MKKPIPEYFRNFVLGAEDSLVSTVGVLFGIASTSVYTETQIFLTGIVSVFVAAVSMGTSVFLSETETQEVEEQKKSKGSHVLSGFIMFTSYLTFGTISVIPFIFMPAAVAKYISLGIALFSLFIIDFVPTRKFGSAIRMMVVASLAVLVGVVVAGIFKTV